MSAVRRVDGLLSARQTVALLEMIQRHPNGVPRQQLLRDLAATFPATWAKADHTIELLCELSIIGFAEARVSIDNALKKDDRTSWFDYMAKRVTAIAAQKISSGEHVRCLQGGGESGGLWLDSMLLPAAREGLPLWIIEFGTASRERISSRFWRISAQYEALFLDAARQANRQRARRSITLVQLHAQLDEDAVNGLIAEKWVLEFERKRLTGHPLVDQVRRISEDDVAAGYDIVSFSSSTALHHDLFIEVKSYVGSKRFFWSRNEIACAEALGEDYSLYLIDREMLASQSYEPQIIRGPHSALFKSSAPGWAVSPTTFECVALPTE